MSVSSTEFTGLTTATLPKTSLLTKVLEEQALRDALLFTICTDNGYNFVNVRRLICLSAILSDIFIVQASIGLVAEDNKLCCAHTLQLAVMVSVENRKGERERVI